MPPKISIIVPVYKAEAYLEACVESILAQTFKDYELWLVDDGSPDRSGELCEGLKSRDARIHVLHKANGGASDARNVGMSKATGEYIGFVDSDDVIEPMMYEILLREMEGKEADVAECLLDKYNESGAFKSYSGEHYNTYIYNTEEALLELILERRVHQTPVNKLYRANVAKGHMFKVGTICEDEYWTYRVVGDARRTVSIDAILYHYYQSEESVMRQSYSPKRLACIPAFEERMKFMAEHYPALYPIANKSYLHACFFHYQTICRNSDIDSDGELRKGLHSRFMDGDWKSLLSLESPKQRLWYRMFMAYPQLTCKLRNLLKIGF